MPKAKEDLEAIEAEHEVAETLVAEEEQPLELTEREIAIAEGRDPDQENTFREGDGGEDAKDGSDKGRDALSAEAPADSDDQPEQHGVESDDRAAETWVTDDLVSLAASYGLSETELDQFSDSDEFFRYARMVERSFARQQPSQPVQSQQHPAQPSPLNQPSAPQSQPAASQPEAAKPQLADLKIDLEKFEEGYDPEVADLARVTAAMQQQLLEQNRLIQDFVPRFEHQQRAAHQERVNRGINEFDSLADKWGGRYGARETLTTEQYASRLKLLEAAGEVAGDIVRAGRPLPPPEVLFKRAELRAFADEIAEERKSELAERVRKQASRRRPVGRRTSQPSGRRAPAYESGDPIKAIANDPEVVAAWRTMQEV